MTKSAHTFALIRRLRRLFRPRGEHHRMCSSRDGKACDCYASNDNDAHVMLDEIEAFIRELMTTR